MIAKLVFLFKTDALRVLINYKVNSRSEQNFELIEDDKYRYAKRLNIRYLTSFKRFISTSNVSLSNNTDENVTSNFGNNSKLNKENLSINYLKSDSLFF